MVFWHMVKGAPERPGRIVDCKASKWSPPTESPRDAYLLVSVICEVHLGNTALAQNETERNKKNEKRFNFVASAPALYYAGSSLAMMKIDEALWSQWKPHPKRLSDPAGCHPTARRFREEEKVGLCHANRISNKVISAHAGTDPEKQFSWKLFGFLVPPQNNTGVKLG